MPINPQHFEDQLRYISVDTFDLLALLRQSDRAISSLIEHGLDSEYLGLPTFDPIWKDDLPQDLNGNVAKIMRRIISGHLYIGPYQSQANIRRLMQAIAGNPKFKARISSIEYSAGNISEFVFPAMPKLTKLGLGIDNSEDEDEDDDREDTTVSVAGLDLSPCPQLQKLYLYNISFVGGWPDFSSSTGMTWLSVFGNKMPYPPLDLPPSLEHLDIDFGKMVALPNISSKALPVLSFEYYGDFRDGLNCELSEASIIALRTKLRHLTEADPFIVNGHNYVNEPLTRQMLREHFTKLKNALIAAMQADQLRVRVQIPKHRLKVYIYKFIAIKCSKHLSFLPDAIVAKIVAMDSSCLDMRRDFVRHIRASAGALKDIIDESDDLGSQTLLKFNLADEFKGAVVEAKKQLKQDPAFALHRAQYDGLLRQTLFSAETKADLNELKARQGDATRPKQRLFLTA